MSVEFDFNLCNSCKGQDEPFCVRYCPGDLLAIDEESGKPYIRDEGDCWDCMVCVKSCPLGAIETRLPYPLASYKASLKPKILKDRIIWYLKDAAGREEVFEIKTLE